MINETNKMNNKCSVIVPCFNVESYICNCVERLYSQTYKQLEIILIEDGSTDNTYEVCKELSRKYNDVVLLTHGYEEENGGKRINKGLEATRNKGLEAATGDYICFVDADDWLDENTIKKSIDALNRYEADVVVFGFDMVYPNKIINCLAEIDIGFQNTKDFVENIGEKVPWQFFSCVGNKLYRSSFIEQYKLRFDSNFKYNEDSQFFINILMHKPKISYIKETYYKYSQREGSINHVYKPDLYFYTNSMLNEFGKMLRLYGLDKRLWYVEYRRLYAAFYALRDELLHNGFFKYKELLKAFGNDDELVRSLINNTKSARLSLKEKILNKLILYRNAVLLQILISIRVKQTRIVDKENRKKERQC